MKMKIHVLEKNDYGFNLKGSRALKLMMDNETPPIDLLVRESIQNSADAVRDDKDHCVISFRLSNFNNELLANSLENIGGSLLRKYNKTTQKYLLITDKMTTGLLGEAFEDLDKPNNLYKLVYSFLESGKNDDSGGSWGIGKSVYYRFGIGIVFYYSRTFENGEYLQKLAGAIIENEEMPDALLRDEEYSVGIAFFGEHGEGKQGSKRSIPIMNDDQINEFLDIFNVQPFMNDVTGTKIIIPYFNESQLTSIKNCDEMAFWNDDFEQSMIASIKRWYFPRLNNNRYNGKDIIVKVNDLQVELCPFYQTLQNLYNGTLENANRIDITTTTFNQKIGTFHYKKITKQELGIMISPENLPSPYAFFDVKKENDSDQNDAFIFYTRKPGMIITFDESRRFTSLKSPQDEYIIGVFVLNDEASFRGEKVGFYFKECERANHKYWEDLSTSETIRHIITLKSKPFKLIRNQISKELSSKFGISLPEEILTRNTILQKKLGELLLPPEDFGKEKEPSIPRGKKVEKPPLLILRKEKRTNVVNHGFIDGYPNYTFQVFLKSNEKYDCKIIVTTSSKKYGLDEWDKMDFVLPCYIKVLQLDGYILNKITFNHSYVFNFDNELPSLSIQKTDGNKDIVFKVTAKQTTESKKTYGFRLINPYCEELRMTFRVILEPVDDTIGFSFIQNISKIGGNTNGN